MPCTWRRTAQQKECGSAACRMADAMCYAVGDEWLLPPVGRIVAETDYRHDAGPVAAAQASMEGLRPRL